MKAFAWRASYVVLYAAAGAAFLWAGASRGAGYYAAGLCFLALAVWEGWTALRERRTGRTGRPGWSLTMNAAYILLALCQVYRSVLEPTGFHIGMAVCWSVLGVLYAAKAVRELRAAKRNKEES